MIAHGSGNSATNTLANRLWSYRPRVGSTGNWQYFADGKVLPEIRFDKKMPDHHRVVLGMNDPTGLALGYSIGGQTFGR
jgi:hypothetical protein